MAFQRQNTTNKFKMIPAQEVIENAKFANKMQWLLLEKLWISYWDNQEMPPTKYMLNHWLGLTTKDIATWGQRDNPRTQIYRRMLEYTKHRLEYGLVKSTQGLQILLAHEYEDWQETSEGANDHIEVYINGQSTKTHEV